MMHGHTNIKIKDLIRFPAPAVRKTKITVLYRHENYSKSTWLIISQHDIMECTIRLLVHKPNNSDPSRPVDHNKRKHKIGEQ